MPLFRVLITLVAVLAFCSGSTVSAAQTRSAIVVVVKSGLVPGGAGSDYAEYGLLLRNRSHTRDALAVRVEVAALDGQGRAIASDRTAVTVIPARASFAVGGSLIWNVSIDIARIRATVRVGRTAAKGRKLPPVTKVAVANNGGDVTASITNPYARALPRSATVYGIALDASGHIVGSASQMTGAVVQPEKAVDVDLFMSPTTTTQGPRVDSAIVSVDPCGRQASTRACPIAGANG